MIFLRQGETPDIITGTAKFSPYNLSNIVSSTTSGTYELTVYPSQAGGYQQWAQNGNVYPVSGGTTPDSTAITTSFANVCPTGYSNPTYNDFNSLVTDADIIGGFYADGFFDRLEFSIKGFGNTNMPYVEAGNNTAFACGLFYNLNSMASLFFPEAGRMPFST